MTTFKSIKYFFIFIITLSTFSCGDDDTVTDNNTSNFDRSAMLTHWADNIIIPSYTDFNTKTNALKTASDSFIAQPNQNSLEELRNKWEEAYLSWQRVEMFNVGPAKDSFLRSFLNIYPSNTSNIDSFINTQNYSLTDPSTNDEQGFPALDYLLYGLSNQDALLVELYDNDNNGDKYRNYLNDVVTRINVLATQVLEEWDNNYRTVFVNNTSSSANGSINKLANAYLEYYEVYFRNGKIGIPAGVYSGGNENPALVEAPFRKNLSRDLSLEALRAFQDFFNGSEAISSPSGPSFKTYLDFLDTMKDGENLSTLINNQFENTRTSISTLNNSFFIQIENDNNAMLNTFEALQDNVILLKSDMFSALSLTLEFESGDGD